MIIVSVFNEMPLTFSTMKKSIERNNWDTAKTLVTYLWPKGQPGLRLRVVLAMTCLLLAKVITIYAPFLYKAAVDSLSVQTALALPAGVIVSFGLARVMTQVFGELRDLIF